METREEGFRFQVGDILTFKEPAKVAVTSEGVALYHELKDLKEVHRKVEWEF